MDPLGMYSYFRKLPAFNEFATPPINSPSRPGVDVVSVDLEETHWLDLPV